MTRIKITVLKRHFDEELAKEYVTERYRNPCTKFTDGQEIVVESDQRPEEDFCDFAWNDIHKTVLTMMRGGDFTTWMKDPEVMIACCTDGVRPVVFKLERIE